jgi:hypothetical protein
LMLRPPSGRVQRATNLPCFLYIGDLLATVLRRAFVFAAGVL